MMQFTKVESSQWLSYSQIRISSNSPSMEIWPEWSGSASTVHEEYVSSLDCLLVSGSFHEDLLKHHLVMVLHKENLKDSDIPINYIEVASVRLRIPENRIDIGDVVDFGILVIDVDVDLVEVTVYAHPDVGKRDRFIITLY